jgi:hypothetical protein
VEKETGGNDQKMNENLECIRAQQEKNATFHGKPLKENQAR